LVLNLGQCDEIFQTSVHSNTYCILTSVILTELRKHALHILISVKKKKDIIKTTNL